MLKFLVENNKNKKIYFVEKVREDERLLSWAECQETTIFVKWCIDNNLVPKEAVSLEKYMQILNEENQDA